ncbi:MAG: tRNA pseudouridine(55) synthase TruB [Mycoplasmoidaceae bacterium]
MKIILFNKKCYQTSNQLVQIVKLLTNSKKAGHSGTLDPLATGLMIIALDGETKHLNKLINLDKVYQFKIKFGFHTDTFDKEGRIVLTSEIFPSIEDINKAILYFNNSWYMQKVPIFSSVKINGKKLYEYARKNIQITPPSRNVNIKWIKCLNYDEKDKIVEIIMNVSKGFYIRSFAVDFSEFLNTYGYIQNLKRVKIGDYDIQNSISDYDDLWQYHEKIEIINKDSSFNDSYFYDLIIGHFDIIHKGHREMFKLKNFNVLIFVNNPSKKWYINSILNRILNLDYFNPQKIYVYDIKNNNIPAIDFNNLVLKKINPKTIIIGDNFYYGNNLQDSKILSNSFDVKIISSKNNISSTMIRKKLTDGDLDSVNKLQINLFKIKGIVIRGKQLGRLLNFPTINVEWKTNTGIKSGSYASFTIIGRKCYKSTSFFWNIKDNKVLSETYIHDFNREIYNHLVEIYPVKFLDNFKKLNSKKKLIEKISKEVNESRKILLDFESVYSNYFNNIRNKHG